MDTMTTAPRTYFRLTTTVGLSVWTRTTSDPYEAQTIRDQWENKGYTVTITEGRTGMGWTSRPIQ